MKTFRVNICIAAATAVVCGLCASKLRADSGAPDPVTRSRIDRSFGKLPLQFEANQGQQPAQVKFVARGQDYTVFLTPDGAVLSLRKVRHQIRIDKPGPPVTEPKLEAAADLRLRLAGGNAAVRLTGADPLPGGVNYFIGKDPAKWRTGVTAYSRVRYEQVYPGIDLVFYGNQRQLEYDFVLGPGSNPDAIRLAVEGAERTSVDPATGDLVLQAAGEEIRFHKPVVYQPAAGGAPRREVDGRFRVSHANESEVAFEVASYDHARTLVVDPVLAYSTFLGGSGEDYAAAVTTDKAGNAYVTGYTCSANFPTTSGSYRPTQPGHGAGTYCDSNEAGSGADVFVSKLNPAGTALIFSTYLGGSYEDAPKGIAADAEGNVVVAGQTLSPDFPVTNSSICAPVNVNMGSCVFAEQSTCQGSPYFNSGNYGSFITKLNPTGASLVWSTFMGGSGNDNIAAMALNGAGDVYLAVNTTSTPQYDTLCTGNPAVTHTWPVTGTGYLTAEPANGWQTATHQAFTEISGADGSTLLYSTLFGAPYNVSGTGGVEYFFSIAVDSAGKAYIGGETTNSDFPTTAGAYQPACAACTNGNRQNGVVVAFDPSQSGAASLEFSTFLGGNGDGPDGAACPLQDGVNAIAVDAASDVYVTGSACSVDFPTVHGAYQRTDPKATGCKTSNAFLAKLNSAGSTLEASTFLNGTTCNGTTTGYGLSVDSSGNAYVTGATNDPAFPTVNPVQTGTSNAAFVTELNRTASELLFSTGLGDGSGDAGFAIHADNFGNVYVVGVTYGALFPTTTGAAQTTYGGGLDDGFLTRIALTEADLAVLNSAPTTALTGTNLTYSIGVTNNGPNTAFEVTLADSVPRGTTFVSASTSAGACQTPAVGAASGRVTCTAPSLANAAGFAVSMVVKVTARSGNTLSDTASVSSLVLDPTAANNSATATTTVN
jgi:uncharacterized repeat protein (TIGR01451 family)